MAGDTHKPAKTRTRQTRDWIIASFNRLVLRRKYSDISVAELVERAGVGRSTFYEHFDHKDDVLRSAVRVILEPMAQLVREDAGLAGVVAVIEHVREHNAAAMAMLQGEARMQLEQALGELVVAQLSRAGHGYSPTALPLMGAQIACAQLGLLRAWLGSPAPACAAAELAGLMHTSTRAMVAAVR
ncbi:MAG: TetR/AcrR family transcriptional regulator [Planctomycetota bacterium]|nr:TetR/AcrR family transcriptional regulator [Planctomycetota bacterium]